MGIGFLTKCKKCGHEFIVKEGGGFMFHLLHCDKCGKDKSISFSEIGETHLRYLKGLGGPYCVATSEQDRYIQENYPGEPITEEEYYKAVEEILGQCECGGYYRFKTKARCPKCGSDDFEDIDEGGTIHYD